MGRQSTNGICSVEWCDEKIRSKGLCKRHYEQMRVHGKIFPLIKNRSKPNEIRTHKDYSEIVILSNDGEEFALIKIDNDMVEELSKTKWYMQSNYAHGFHNGKYVLMHKLILNTDKDVDHANCDKNDNRRANLRPATRSQNTANKGKQSNNTSGYKGVYYNKKTNKYAAKIVLHGKSKYLGRFNNIIDAAKAYDMAAVELFGEFAYLNFREVI